MRGDRMNRIVFLGICLMLVFLTGPVWGAETWKKVETQIDREKERAEKDAALTEGFVKKDRSALLKELKSLKAQQKQEKKTLESLKRQFQELLKKEEAFTNELTEEHQEVEAVEGTVRSATKEAASLIRDNLITPEYPKRPEMVTALLESRRFPGLQGIQSLMGLYFEELEAGGTITRRSGSFVGPDGRNASGDIIRVGRFTSYYRFPDTTVGFLKPEASGERLIAVPGEAPRTALKAIGAYFDGNTNVLPIDPSGGAVFAQMTEKRDWRDLLEMGGILMWPILFVAGLALLLILELLIVLGTTKANTDKIMDKINALGTRGEWKECEAICEKKKRVPTCRMLRSAMGHLGATQELLENALQEGILKEMPRLERFLPTLGVLAAIAPLLGLLGTVTGMINTFQVITAVGTGDPRMMSGGISEALLTTQFGLTVAIPIMIIHHFLERRVDKIVGDMEEKGTAFAVTMIKSGAVVEGDAESAG